MHAFIYKITRIIRSQNGQMLALGQQQRRGVEWSGEWKERERQRGGVGGGTGGRLCE